MGNWSNLQTEQRNPATEHIDEVSTLEMLALINREDALVPAAVAAQLAPIAEAVDLVASQLGNGGRLFYLGAGTSGRLGILDAAECPPTFSADPEQIQGLIAGGPAAVFQAVEGAEDDREAAPNELAQRGLGPADVVMGIAASGVTPFVISGMEYAAQQGCPTIFFTCSPTAAKSVAASIKIVPEVGPEVITGSTRMKAGTATKLVLNMISTGAMVKLGKTYGNLMVDLQPTNAKLRDRAERIFVALTGTSPQVAAARLQAAEGRLETGAGHGAVPTRSRPSAAPPRYLRRERQGRHRSKPLQYANLGRTSLRLSALGLGTVQLGMAYGWDQQPPPPDDRVIGLIRRALELGINYIDTASEYGRSESLVGRACAGLTCRPAIATKLSIRDPDNAGLLTGQALRQSVEQSLRQSLQMLGVDALDLVQLHSLDTRFATPELLELLAQYCQRGWVRYWGVTTYGEEAPLDALDHPELISALQIPYSALDRRMERKVIPRAQAQGTGVILRSIFLQGILSHRLDSLPPTLADLSPLVAPLLRLAQDAGIELAELALRFAAFASGAHSTIFGTTSISELEANIRAVEAGPLPPDLVAAVRAIEVADSALLNPGNWRVSTP